MLYNYVLFTLNITLYMVHPQYKYDAGIHLLHIGHMTSLDSYEYRYSWPRDMDFRLPSDYIVNSQIENKNDADMFEQQQPR